MTATATAAAAADAFAVAGKTRSKKLTLFSEGATGNGVVISRVISWFISSESSTCERGQEMTSFWEISKRNVENYNMKHISDTILILFFKQSFSLCFITQSYNWAWR